MTAAPAERPPAPLRLHRTVVPPSDELVRLFRRRFPDPLGLGHDPARFSDPRGELPIHERFAVLHLGASFEVAFVETVLRDRGDGRTGDLPIPERELDDWRCARIRATTRLSLVDLTSGRKRMLMAVPSDVVGAAAQRPSRSWAVAFHAHPTRPDGIAYPSRLVGERCYAIFDRAVARLRVQDGRPLLQCTELPDMIRRYELAILL